MNNRNMSEVLEDLEKKIERKPTVWDFLVALLVVCKFLGIGDPATLKVLTWWHVFLVPYGIATTLAVIGWAIREWDVAKRLGITAYRVISWFKRLGSKRAA